MDASVAVLKTLAYEDIFDYPLTFEEIYRFQPSEESRARLRLALEQLLKEKKVEQEGSLFFLSGRKRIVSLRRERVEWAKEKRLVVEKVAQKLGQIPGIKMIGLTGALAMESAKKEDDIDLVVITAPDSLWLTRLLIFLLCPFLGISRRKPKDKEFKDKICFNLFLEEGSLRVGPPSLFLAHEIGQVKPLLVKDNLYEQFLRANRWVKDYLPNLAIPSRPAVGGNSSFLRVFLNSLAFILQYLYMKPKMTVEKVSLHQAFFHPQDLSVKVMIKYGQRLKDLIILE